MPANFSHAVLWRTRLIGTESVPLASAFLQARGEWQRRKNANAGCGLSRRSSSRLRANLRPVGCCAFTRGRSMPFARVRTLEHSLFDLDAGP